MKILLSFLQDNRAEPYPIAHYRFWGTYLKNGIEEAGMQWLEVEGADWAQGITHSPGSDGLKQWKEITWAKTLSFVKKNRQQIDVFLSYLYPQQVDADAINEIRQLGIPCINFYCDNVREFSKVPAEFKVFDLMWVPEYEALDLYKKASVKTINLPMPMWAAPETRTITFNDAADKVSFIGSKDVLREKLLGEAINHQLQIDIWGSGWVNDGARRPAPSHGLGDKLINQLKFIRAKGAYAYLIKNAQSVLKLQSTRIDDAYLHGSPAFDEYIDITKNSAVTLGINRVPTFKRLHSNPLIYSRLRDIEAPMLGACYLTEYCEDLNYLYDLGHEIQVYKTAEELADKAQSLLNDPQKRRQLMINGQKRALNDHSIPASLAKLKKHIF